MHDDEVAIRRGTHIALNQVGSNAHRIPRRCDRIFWRSLGTPSVTRNQETLGHL
jgi:hypothetical protein